MSLQLVAGKKEVESLNCKLREKEEEFEKQLTELKTELKSHSRTISKLESKSDSDFRKSSRVLRVSVADDKDDTRRDISMTSGSTKAQSLVLDLNEGLFQIYLQNLVFDWKDTKLVNNKFQLQWTFYNHDTSFSPWFSGEQCSLEHSTIYKVDINSDFLEYLYSDQCIVNLYMESPENTGIIAMGKLHFSGVLDSPYDKWKLSIPLQLLSNMEVTIGILYCWYQMVCSHKPVRSFIESFCNLRRKDSSSKITTETSSELLHKKNDINGSKKISGDICSKDSLSKHLRYDEPSYATEGQEVGSILPEISSSSEEQTINQCQSAPIEELKFITSEQAEKTSLPQQEENLGKSLDQSSSVVKTDAVLSGSDIKLATSSKGRVTSDKLATQLQASSTPVSEKPFGQIVSLVTFNESSKSERQSDTGSPISPKAVQSSLRKLISSTNNRKKNQSTLPVQENTFPSDSSKSSEFINAKLSEKLIRIAPEKEEISSIATQNFGNSMSSEAVEEKEAEGSVRSFSVNYGKQFSSSVITPLGSDSKSSIEKTEDIPNDSAAKGMPDPTSDSHSEGDANSVFEENNWRNYSLRSLQTQKETAKETTSSPPATNGHQNYPLNWASDESSSVSIIENLQKSDMAFEDKEVSKDELNQISSSSTSDAEKDLDIQQLVAPEPSVQIVDTNESCEIPVKWKESINAYISQSSSRHVAIQNDEIKEAPSPHHKDDNKDIAVKVKNKSLDSVNAHLEPSTSGKGRRRIPHIYQDPEVSRYQDLNDLMMRKQEEKERRICCFNISSNQSQTIPDSIEIVIHSLTLAHNTGFMRNSDVTQLYIEYSFLGYDGEEMETMSASLNTDLHMNFNYRRTFYVDYGMHFKQRTILSNILTSEDKNRRNLRFIVVSEPPEEQDHVKECEEIGYAEVDLVQLMTEGRDLIKENIPVRTVDGTERIGFLTISITGVKLMHKVAFETK